MDHHTVETCTVVRWISISGIFWEEWTPCAPDQRRKDHPDCYQQQVQKPGSVMVWGCVSALGKGNLHFCDGTINAEKYIEILEHNMLPSRRHLFQGRPCIFQQTMQNHILHTLQSPGCRGRGYGYLTGLPAVRPVSNRECVAHFEAQNATTKTPYCCPP